MTDGLRLQVELFGLALARARRGTPVRAGLGASDDLVVRALRHAPLAGATLAAVTGAVIWGAALMLPQAAAVVLGLAIALALTEGRALLGFGRMVDTLVAGGSARLDQRRTPGRGPEGAGMLAVALALALQVALLVALAPAQAIAALLAAGAFGGMARVHVLATTLGARRQGMRARVFDVGSDCYRVGLLETLTALLPLALLGTAAVVGAATGAVVAGQLARSTMVRRFGGYTREGLAWVQITAELGALVGIMAVL